MDYRVRLEIDVDGDSPAHAALEAMRMIQAADFVPVVDVFPVEERTNNQVRLGKVVEVDFELGRECVGCLQMVPEGTYRTVGGLGIVGDCCWDERLRTVQ